MDKTTLVVAITALLISLGVPIADRTISTDELNNYYFCDVTEQIMEFEGGTSGTQYSGYPFTDSRKGAVYCKLVDTKGKWIKLSDYAKSLGIDAYELLLKEQKPIDDEVIYKEYAKQWECNQGGCKRLK